MVQNTDGKGFAMAIVNYSKKNWFAEADALNNVYIMDKYTDKP